MQSPITYLDGGTVCSRCHDLPAELVSRKEPFCGHCFIRFIRGKQRKQMQDDRFKVTYGPVEERLGTQRVLLALSCGVSSLVLLDVICSLLQEQRDAHRGRQGFEVVVLSIAEQGTDKQPLDLVPELLKRYLPAKVSFKVLSPDSYVTNTTNTNTSTNTSTNTNDKSEERHDVHTLSSLLSPLDKSSVEDLSSVVYHELVLRTAHLEKCQTVLYGHSMTRIANEIIALTVKGRGSSIHRAVTDHVAHYNGSQVHVMFPLREVLNAETEAYARLAGLDQYVVAPIAPKSKVTRNLTVRDLTTRYFAMLDATGYASTASTVVRTAEKLGPPTGSPEASCRVCGVEIFHNPREWLESITVGEAPSGSHSADMCYGCIVSAGHDIAWPTERGPQVYLNEKEEERRVLEEYSLE